MAGGGAAVAAVAILGGAVAVGVALWMRGQPGGGGGSGGFTIDGQSSTVTLPNNVGHNAVFTVTGANPGDVLQAYWSTGLSSTGTNSNSQATNTFTAGSNGVGTVSEMVNGWADGTGYIGAFNQTQNKWSNFLTVIVKEGGTPPGGLNCTVNQVGCYAGGQAYACCPAGDLCADHVTGACPAGSVADPQNPGCCYVPAIVVRYPNSWIGPTSITITSFVCQPVQLTGCCGTSVITAPPSSFTLRVVDQMGAPMTGVRVLYAFNGGQDFQLDALSYVTDSSGQIYPQATWPGPPTQCSGGVYTGPSDLVTFYVEGYPPSQGYAVASVKMNSVDRHTTHGGSFGGCGSCP